MSWIVSAKWLQDRIENDIENTVIVDVRFQLGNPEYGKDAYLASHIPHAVFLDLEKDLSGPVNKHGGNHPLPSASVLAQKLGQVGIDRDQTVVIYDQANDMFAPRLWWMLRYMGHEHVNLLDGGLNSWIKAGYQVTDELPNPQPKTFHPQLLTHSVVNIEQVKEKLSRSAALIIDSRAEERYLGYKEPLYKKAGHIPGAKNYFWKGVLNDEGYWKSVQQLEEHFSTLNKQDEIIVSCGSGVSACPNIIGLLLAGYENVKLYPGGYSDWISYEENNIITKED